MLTHTGRTAIFLGAPAIAAALAFSAFAQPAPNPVLPGTPKVVGIEPGDKKAEPPPPPPIKENPTEIEQGVYFCLASAADGATAKSPYQINIGERQNYLLYMNEGTIKEPGIFDFAGGVITWKTGPMLGKPPGKYDGDAHARPAQMRITLQPEGAPLSCYMNPGPA